MMVKTNPYLPYHSAKRMPCVCNLGELITEIIFLSRIFFKAGRLAEGLRSRLGFKIHVAVFDIRNDICQALDVEMSSLLGAGTVKESAGHRFQAHGV